MAEPQAGKEKPTCISIVICSEVIEDKRTNNKTLVGLFNRIQTPQFPCQHLRMFVVASLTNGIGKWPITIRITSPSQNEMMRLEGEVDSNDPLAVMDIVLEIKGMVLQEAGVHFVDLYVGKEVDQVYQRRFLVELMKGNR